MLDPIPRRYTVCSHLFLPRCHRPSPNRDGSAARVCPTNYDFSWRAILEVADIPLCSGLQVCSPPRSFLPLRILLQGSRGFYVRAYRALLPPHAPDMLTVRIQVIDGTGTFTLSDSQPCRLLTSLHRRYPASAVLRTSPPPQGAQPVPSGFRLVIADHALGLPVFRALSLC